VLNLEDTPDLGIRRSLKPQFLPRNALDYLAPRSRIAYFFDSASNVPGSWLRELRPRAAIAEPAERAAPGGRVARQPSRGRVAGRRPSLTVCGINRAALRLLGLKPERALGVRPTLLCGSLEDETFWMGAEQDPYARIRSDTVLTHSDGHPRWVSRSISPLHLPGGDHYWLVLLHDQTRRRRAEAERETLLAELRATLESTADGILVVDLAGRVRSFNRRFAKLWGLPGGCSMSLVMPGFG
jgi:PAS domain S-box-containing protein